MAETTDCICPLSKIVELFNHPPRTDNPHQVTADQVDTYSKTEINALLASAVADLYTKAEVDALLASVDGVSTGTVTAFADAVAPMGWLVCDGTAVSRANYPALFAIVGETYGVGDGSTTFNLPDLRGEFVRGWDNERGIDADRVLGSWQEDALQNLTGEVIHVCSSNGAGLSASGVFGIPSLGSHDGDFPSGDLTPVVDEDHIDFDASRVARTADETRPRNVSLLYCIKA